MADKIPEGFPVWKIRETTDSTKVTITCPRKACRMSAVVATEWFRCNEYKTRACTYCFKASAIPDELIPDRNKKKKSNPFSKR